VTRRNFAPKGLYLRQERASYARVPMAGRTLTGQRPSGSYVKIYNLSANWNCTRAY
jgi:hypothetical protein